MTNYCFIFFASHYPDNSAFTQNISRLIHAIRDYFSKQGGNGQIMVVSSSSYPEDINQSYYEDASIIHQYRDKIAYDKAMTRHRFQFFLEDPLWQMRQAKRLSKAAKNNGYKPIVVLSTQFLFRTLLAIHGIHRGGGKALIMRTEKPISLHSESVIRTRKEKINRFLQKSFFFHVYSKADGIVAETDYLERYYRALTKGRVPTCILPTLLGSGFDLDAQQCGFKDKFIITYAGGLGPGKKDGVPYLVKAASIINKSDVEIHIIGNIVNKAFVNNLHNMSDQCESTKVIFMHNLSRENYVKALGESDLLVLYKEKDYYTNAGMSSKLIEYMQCAKPVVLTKYVNPFPIPLEDEVNCFLVKNDSAEDLANKLLTVMAKSPEELQLIGRHAYEAVVSSLDAEVHMKNFFSFVGSLC